MSNIVSAAGASCSCGMRGEMILRDLNMIPAGSVNGGLSTCGYPSELSLLPVTAIKKQVYTEGLCPDSALSIGTMFPELADIYK